MPVRLKAWDDSQEHQQSSTVLLLLILPPLPRVACFRQFSVAVIKLLLFQCGIKLRSSIGGF